MTFLSAGKESYNNAFEKRQTYPILSSLAFMPSISSNDKILVTGANGYVALWIIKASLEKGYSIRAAVRAESKGDHLKELFKDHGSKLELAIVPDMTMASSAAHEVLNAHYPPSDLISQDGAWDEAVKGVHAVVHTATPVDFSHPNPNPES